MQHKKQRKAMRSDFLPKDCRKATLNNVHTLKTPIKAFIYQKSKREVRKVCFLFVNMI